MISIKKVGLILFLPLVLLNANGCAGKIAKIETIVSRIADEAFGNIAFDLTQEDFEKAGFHYDDLMKITIHDAGNDIGDLSFEVAFVKNYNEAGYFAPCLCNYGGVEEAPQLSFGIMPQKDHVDTLLDKKVTIEMVKEQGYHKTRELIDVATKLTYEEVGKDNLAYANFRDISTVGSISKHIKANRAFRGSSPFNRKGNPDERDYVADSYLKVYGIESEVSLANTAEEIEELMKDVGRRRLDSYTRDLYLKSQEETSEENKPFYATCLGGDYFTTGIEGKHGDAVKQVFQYMVKRITKLEGPSNPLYFHCNEGKDRTGFFAMVLEALTGCPLDDLVADAMLTFKNYYNVSVVNNKEKYDTLANLLIYRHIYSILVDDPVNSLPKINWYEFDAKSQVEKIIGSFGNILSECAQRYLFQIGLSIDEIRTLNAWLTTEKNN